MIFFSLSTIIPLPEYEICFHYLFCQNSHHRYSNTMIFSLIMANQEKKSWLFTWHTQKNSVLYLRLKKCEDFRYAQDVF